MRYAEACSVLRCGAMVQGGRRGNDVRQDRDFQLSICKFCRYFWVSSTLKRVAPMEVAPDLNQQKKRKMAWLLAKVGPWSDCQGDID